MVATIGLLSVHPLCENTVSWGFWFVKKMSLNTRVDLAQISGVMNIMHPLLS